jgi:hypothetical protein
VRRIIGRRTAVRWMAAVPVAAVVALTVSGCGQPQVGAAALYSSQRISAQRLSDEVANLNAGYQAYKSKLQIQYTPAEMPRKVLSWMLQFATYDKIAASEGIHVTSTQALAQEVALKRRALQSGDTLREVAVLAGLPPDMLNQAYRWLAIRSKLEIKLTGGVAPRTQAEASALQLKVNHVQCVAAKDMNIRVNPQFGAFDYGQFVVVAAPKTLSATGSARQATPSPAPRLKPAC